MPPADEIASTSLVSCALVAVTIALNAGDCFCEQIPEGKGSVEHARVVLAMPPKVLRLTGGLGPLQSMPVNAVMEWSLRPLHRGTELSMRYTVDGAIPGGGKALAPIVDKVLAEQFERLKAYVEKDRE